MSSLIINGPEQPIAANIHLPASKSICNRAFVLSAIYPEIQLQNKSTADDSLIMEQALKQGTGAISVKNAGTCMRFLTAYFAATPGSDVILHGTARMHERPVGTLVEALKNIGADIEYLDQPGFPPLHIKGRLLHGGVTVVDASVSSQFISALMLIAPLCKNGLVITTQNNQVSQPYIYMTAALMQQCGIAVTLKQDIVVRPFRALPEPVTIAVEPDWSAAGYWYVVAALAQNVRFTLVGLTPKSIQGDAVIRSIMNDFGVQTVFTPEGAVLTSTGKHVENGYYNMADYPDLVPSLAVLACALNIPCTFVQVAHLEAKESKRLTALCTELQRCGFACSHNGQELFVYKADIQATHAPGGGFNTYDDHRMAMAFAPLAMVFNEIMINGPEAVNKSYPHFWSDLQTAGFGLHPVNS